MKKRNKGLMTLIFLGVLFLIQAVLLGLVFGGVIPLG